MASDNVRCLESLVSDQSGQDLVEYALMAALIALGAVVSMKAVAGALGTTYQAMTTQLTTAFSGT